MPAEFRFDDGAAYDRYMGVWSRTVGSSFLEWLAPPKGWTWLDVGCGNGAFTRMIAERCAPAMIHGIDPSEGQLAFARTQLPPAIARFEKADAMALPFGDDSMDAAVMPLVIFFVPDPAVGVAEMARVVRAGGIVAAYAWDMPGRGFPYAAVNDVLRATGIQSPKEANPDASRLDRMQELWTGAGLHDVETREITVERTYPSFDEYWEIILGGPSAGQFLRAFSPEERERFQKLLRERLGIGDTRGPFALSARANAVRGRVK
ncbi:MAG: methyltransferase domain-containing protein [Gemmatimonadaceae bacterium]|nr:methyltransferase domain-containing protein [Gemmatimonadaceae bacterium]NUQ93040.1 methyltransferase domain-containing protein [Gemmatimonadaceae bacterium]NUR18431.1 methyltransferase domain-containing protein [Gemmatimonadaceae bacterium]NUS96239.1 methyltransferase domain-containing protein [Gemmatimonadaceae bacterium]